MTIKSLILAHNSFAISQIDKKINLTDAKEDSIIGLKE